MEYTSAFHFLHTMVLLRKMKRYFCLRTQIASYIEMYCATKVQLVIFGDMYTMMIIRSGSMRESGQLVRFKHCAVWIDGLTVVLI